MKEAEPYDVGVIIGRFQVPSLHEGHIDLFNSVLERHDKVLVFIGLAEVFSEENPLDFESRKQMILGSFPNLNLSYIPDEPTDEGWSRSLDYQVGKLCGPNQSAVLYGSRASFIDAYKGKLPTRALESEKFLSGSAVRREVCRKSARATADFRAGAVWQAGNSFPTAFPTVDVAVFDTNFTKLLLGKKPKEPKYRFIGGFVDPVNDASFLAAANREVREEASIAVGGLRPLGSMKVDDWRYRNTKNCIMTTLFEAQHQWGTPKAADDLEEVAWFPYNHSLEDQIMELHLPLLKLLTQEIGGSR